MLSSDTVSQLRENGTVLRTTSGVSMLPLIRSRRDQVVISVPSDPPKVNDVILFTTAKGKYILHRVIKVRDGSYITRGDNCLKKDLPVPAERIYGVLDGVYRKDKFVDCRKSPKYKAYVLFYARGLYPLRSVYYVARKCAGAVYRRFFKCSGR